MIFLQSQPSRGYRALVMVAVLFGLTTVSCSHSTRPKIPNQKPVVKVSGEVFVDGKPEDGIGVTLLPQGEPGALPSSGRTDQDGKFVITTYIAGDGAPKGDYLVLFERRKLSDLDDSAGPDDLKNLYNDPKTSTFKVTVGDKPLEIPRYDLKVEGEEAKPDPYEPKTK